MNKVLSKSKLILASPRGFCAGVERAVEILQRAIDLLGAPVYVKHEVVHNKYIIEDFEKKGVMFIEDINSIPDEAVLIYSAHGVSNKIKEIAKKKNLKIFDATCPLVTKVHLQVHKYASQNIDVVLIGHIGHPEIEGTMGRYESEKGKLHLVQFEDDIDSLDIDNPNLAYVTQTTLSVDDTKIIIDRLKKKFPNIVGPVKDDICYATQNRQDAVKSILQLCDFLIVIGSKNSSNSRRLKELALKNDVESVLIDDKSDLDLELLATKEMIGITAGASAPEILFDEVLNFLLTHGAIESKSNHVEIVENISFSLPKELKEL